MWGQEEEKEEFARIHYQEKAAHYPGACLTTLLPAPCCYMMAMQP